MSAAPSLENNTNLLVSQYQPRTKNANVQILRYSYSHITCQDWKFQTQFSKSILFITQWLHTLPKWRKSFIVQGKSEQQEYLTRLTVTRAPVKGPTQYIQWYSQWPDTIAGPKARAGFIHAPDIPPLFNTEDKISQITENWEVGRLALKSDPNTVH